MGSQWPPSSFSVSKALQGLHFSPSRAATGAWNPLAFLIKSVCSVLKTGPGSLLPTLGV